MTLLFFDGFETYNDSTDMQLNGYGCVGNCSKTTIRTASPSPRSGLAYANFYDYLQGIDRPYAANVLDQADETLVIVGLAGRMEDPTGTYSSGRPFITLRGGTGGGSNIISFFVDGTAIRCYYQTSTTLLFTTSSGVIGSAEWAYYEFKVYHHATDGYVELRRNGVTIGSVGIDSSSASVNTGASSHSLRLMGINDNNALRCDDLYICNGDGSKNNDFLGDCIVECLRPNGDGTHKDFTPYPGDSSSAVANFENVDDSTGPDEDTTYNEADTLGDKDSYTLEDLSPGGEIYGVKRQAVVRTSDPGLRKIKILSRINLTDYLGDEENLGMGWQYYLDLDEDNPDASSGEWSESDINSMEIGVEVTS